MQAVILAGGLGTRLRPLTYTTPKPLLPILNEPMVTRLIKTFPKEIDSVIIAASYKVDRLREHFSEHDLGLDIIIVEEKEPLGTGGAIKNAERHIDDTFLAFNGDVICSLDLGTMVAFHRKKKARGTISMWEVEDPSRFGILGVDSDGRVNRFLEKPSPKEAFSNWINAGVYVLEPEILNLMKPGTVVSIEREVFPLVAEKGTLFGFKFTGFWVDAGTPRAYLDAHRILLDGQRQKKAKNIPNKVTINPPVLVGDNCEFLGECQLGPYACLGDDVVVSEGTVIKNTVVLGGSNIGKNNVLDDVILGYDCTIEDNARMGSEVIVGDAEVVKRNAVVPPKSTVGRQ